MHFRILTTNVEFETLLSLASTLRELSLIKRVRASCAIPESERISSDLVPIIAFVCEIDEFCKLRLERQREEFARSLTLEEFAEGEVIFRQVRIVSKTVVRKSC